MAFSVSEITKQVEAMQPVLGEIFSEAGRVVVGQKKLLRRLVQALLCDGHVLLEGLPGLAKTLSIKTLAELVQTDFQRVQFTPDLLPSDLIGTMVFSPKTGMFTPKKGPIFTHLLLADEINRAPAKVQSALLEAMGERQVTIGETTYALENLFCVLATQNPIEQEGTYTLPEAQLDRFLFKVKIDYPSVEEEKEILNRMSGVEMPHAKKTCHPSYLLEARKVCASIYMDEKLKDYILNLVFATRFPERFELAHLKTKIAYGASPRATLALTRASRAQAFLEGRGFVTPDDIKAVSFDILRHRILISFEGEAENWNSEKIIEALLETIEVP